MEENSFRKTIVSVVIILFLLTSLSPVYAGFVFSESKAMESKIDETTTIEDRNPLDREFLLDNYRLSEVGELYYEYPYYHHNPIKKPTVIDGEEWDIIVPDDYDTIQEAINNAEMGFRIFVISGVYKENLVIDVQSLTLCGEDKDTTVIDGNAVGTVITITDGGDGVNISEFTIQNSGEGFTGINISSHYNIIQDIILKNNGKGISLYYSSGNQIQDNHIVDNIGDGIWLHRSNGNSIKENILRACLSNT